MRGFRRTAQHETLNMQKHALIGEIYSDFKVGDRVMTIDGFPGKVSAVDTGPFPSTEDYTVVLDNGMGGGTYTSGQLRRLTDTTASRVEASEVKASIPVEAVTEHSANIDYPELEDILERRLPNENIKVFAATESPATSCACGHRSDKHYVSGSPTYMPGDPERRPNKNSCQWCGCNGFRPKFSSVAANNTANDDTDDKSDKLTQQSNDPDDDKDPSGIEKNLPTDEPVDSNQEEGDVPNVTPPSSCSFCGGVDFEDPQMTGRGTRMRCSQCGGTMKSWGGQWEPEFPNSSQNNASEQGDMRSGGVAGVAALPDSNFKTSDLQVNAGIVNWVIDKIFDRIQERTEEAARGGKYHWADESHQNQVAGPPVYKTQYPWVDVPQRNPGGLTIHSSEGRCTACSGSGEQGTGHECYQCDGSGSAVEQDPTIDNANPGNGLLVGRNDAKGIKPVISSLDEGELGFHLTASWVEVQAKARRIRREGGVKIVSASKMFVVGEVQGDTNVYESQLNYVPGSKKVADWGCGCKWASYSWGRSSAFRRFEGRLCSHALALQYEAGARGMFGRGVDEDKFRGTKPVVVRWDKLVDQHLTRDSVLQKSGLTFSHVGEEHNMSEPRNSREGDTSWRSIHAHDEKGNRVGELDYTLNPHDDGGDIDVDGPHLAPGYEHHAPSMMHALEEHLENTRGLKGSRSWTYTDNIGHKFNLGMISYSSLIYDSDQIYPEPQSLDLEHPPIYAFAANMADNGESLANIVQMFASFGMDREATRQMTQEVWLEPAVKGSQIDPKRLLTASWSPNTTAGNDTALEAHTAVGELTQAADDERARKRKKHPHHTNDAREHARVWGYGWPYGIGLMMCGQCNGSGCGHCAGTGQVPSQDESTPTQSPTSSTPDQTLDAGAAISTDGLSASLKMADYSSADPLVSVDQGQNYYAPTPHSHSQNPASTGWATSQDPGDWGRSLISNDFGVTFDASLHTTAKATDPYDGPTVSGVALKAADTGRVLMIQRSIHNDDDPAKGTWEFPGGHHEEEDPTSLHAGIREWEEEIGQSFPHGGHVSHVWRSGPYQGHVVNIPSEKMIDFSQGRSELNPDDPDNDDHEQAAWWDPDHARKNPALRQELKDNSPFGEIKKAAAARDTVQRFIDQHGADEFKKHYNAGWTRSRNVGTFPDRDINSAFEAGYMDHATDLEKWHSVHCTNMNGHHDDCPEAKSFSSTATLLTMDEVLAVAHAEEQRTGKTSEQLLQDHVKEQERYFATLHGEPEPALPSTDGIVDDSTGFPIDHQTNDDVSSILAGNTVDGPHVGGDDANSIRMAFLQTAGAKAMLRDAPELKAKVAMKDFSFAEQQELINEGKGDRARNFNDLKIAGTHYELIPEDADDTILWT